MYKEKIYELLCNVGINVNEAGKIDDTIKVMDSLQFVSLICDIENEFDIFIPDDFLIQNNFESLDDFVEQIERQIILQQEP